MNISRIIEGIRKEKEIDLFEKVKSICRIRGTLKERESGKVFYEYDFGDGLVLQHESYESIYVKSPEHIYINDRKSNSFLPYFRFSNHISSTAFEEIDFSKVPKSIFERIDEKYNSK